MGLAWASINVSNVDSESRKNGFLETVLLKYKYLGNGFGDILIFSSKNPSEIGLPPVLS